MRNSYPSHIKISLPKYTDADGKKIKEQLEKLYPGSSVVIQVKKL